MSAYTTEFFEAHRDGSRRSAQVVVPLVLELVLPKRVVDVGCGVGTWLRVFVENGVTDILGIDGDYVNREHLEIPLDRFLAHDLTRPLRLSQRYDLTLSLEVAEHLPRESVSVFIDSLTYLAPLVLFSAAIPSQAGIDHVNEQWPEYWAEHFDRRGYVTVDNVVIAIVPRPPQTVAEASGGYRGARRGDPRAAGGASHEGGRV